MQLAQINKITFKLLTTGMCIFQEDAAFYIKKIDSKPPIKTNLIPINQVRSYT